MAGKTNVFENDILKLIFWGAAIPGIADNAAASTVTTLYLSLHTADPTDSASNGQSTYEAGGAYSNYARIPMVRSGAAWVIAGDTVAPLNPIDFATAPGGMVGTQVITHAGIGTAETGAGKLLYVGAISPAITVAAGVTPRLTTASTITED